MDECGKKYEPIVIPKGRNGESVCIAFAEDNQGNGFSFVQNSNSKYISIIKCSSCSTLSQNDFTVWTQIEGNDGNDGVSVVDIIVSDGETMIDGVLYPINSIIISLSNGQNINSGIITFNLNWQPLILINGWVEFSSALTETTPMYAIDSFGFLRFKGIISSASGASSDSFNSNLIGLFSVSLNSSLNSSINIGTADYRVTNLLIDNFANNSLRIPEYTTLATANFTTFHLGSIPPIFIE